jgi:hypothetical protein
MANSLRNQNVCQQCWRPSLETRGNHLYCPTCDSKFSKELKLISGPSIDVYDRNTTSTVSAILTKAEGYRHNPKKLVRDLGIELGASAEQWVLAAHHIKCLYRHYRDTCRRPESEFQYVSNPLSVSPPSKRSFPGAFGDYGFDYWRLDDSPFTNLSDDGFQIISSLEVRPTLPWPLHRLFHIKQSARCFSVPRTHRNIYNGIDWQKGLRELLAAGLIQKASIVDNLELASLTQIRSKLKEYGLKSGAKKETAIAVAVKELPANALAELVEPIQGYVLTSITIDEFRLRLYGLPNLKDDVRFHNSIVREKITADEFLKVNREGRGTPEFFDVVLALLENARSASNYGSYLESGMPPVEAALAETYAQLNEFHTAYREVQQAYRLDFQHNDVFQTVNVNHFASLVRFQLQLEFVLSQSHTEFAERIPETEKTLRMWIALYDRMADDGSTSFLLENYREIFEPFGDCSRESENRYRELSGIPRIGEGWVSEVELLNLVRDIFPNEKVIHQASPDWLGLQRLDIFLPRLKMAIEYQGRQHYEPVRYFGGEEGFQRNQERDKRKAELCAQNGVALLYFRYDESINREVVESRIRKALTETRWR